MKYKKSGFVFLGLILLSFLSIPLSFSSQNTNSEAIDQGIIPQEDVKGLTITFLLEGPSITQLDVLNVRAKVNITAGGGEIAAAAMTVHKFNIYSDFQGTTLVASGDLTHASGNEWNAIAFNLAWTGSGTFYVSVVFKNSSMTEEAATALVDDGLHSYGRTNLIEPILITIIIVGSILGVTILIILIRVKKQGVSVERKKKEPKGVIKTKAISKEELKSAKKAKKEAEKKETGKTEIKGDLIFSVPQWEVDDDENS